MKMIQTGEEGKAVHTSMEEKAKADQTVREFGFNMVASDKVAMNRSIPDTRMEETVHSVINTSPPHLLHEVVMVDDDSDKDFLKGPLEEYIKQWNGKVKVYRNKERLGLIQARNRGAELSTGDVIVFLDAHCECNRNWLPPLLSRINYDRSPTHAGGLFAMDRKYFWEMGGYDQGLQIWGGENYELAFKVKEKEGEHRCWDTLGQGVGGGPIAVQDQHQKARIGLGERCIDAPNGDTLHIRYCEVQPTGPWEFDEFQHLEKLRDKGLQVQFWFHK
nr:hypothetical protein BaRGS_012311 [Batillaria attramentaria]